MLLKKGWNIYNQSDKEKWTVPYLPMDPKDIKRDYEKVIRINSQSGKGGASFIVSEFLGVNLSKNDSIEFGKIVKEISDTKGIELSKDEIIEIYKTQFIEC